MSQRLINRSADLQRLQDDGYDIQIVGSYLILRDIPYVSASQQVLRGSLVSSLCLLGDVTTTPDTHVAYFIGEYPCDKSGRPIEQIRHGTGNQTLAEGLIVQHSFSSKPPDGYKDYYHKMTTYAAIIASQAASLSPGMTAQTHPPILSEEPESVFCFRDTATSRAMISDLALKLDLPRIAIIGLGGTGAYVLDLASKTPVREIHLYDDDMFSQHNAFRFPGSVCMQDLARPQSKVALLQARYASMRRGIVAHESKIEAGNVHELDGMSFVFLCIDSSQPKRLIIERLVSQRIPFVDVGMGLTRAEGSLTGIVRVTAGSAGKTDHVLSGKRIAFGDDHGDNEYSRNIQLADLNALNAALAVIKWKKLFGFYLDLEREHHSLYTIDGNCLLNEEVA